MIKQQNFAQDMHVKKVLAWRENLALMPDSHFFELIRMYLGEVKTPYNKHKLIEELSSFLRKAENQQNLVRLLSDTDLQIISVVYFVPSITQEKLGVFFSGVLSFAALYDRLLNLEERLILFRHKESKTDKLVIDINPLLDKILLPFLKFENVLPPPVYAEKSEYSQKILTPLFMACFLSYISSNPDVCKLDGTLKKRPAEVMAEIFPGCKNILQHLVTACLNLALVKSCEKGLVVDFENCALFAKQSWRSQCAYLCVASAFHLSRANLKKHAQLLLDIISSIPVNQQNAGYERNILVRSSLFAMSASSEPDEMPRGRFSRMLEQQGKSCDEVNQGEDFSPKVMETLIEPAVAFGLLAVEGKAESGNEIFVPGINFGNESVASANLKVLSINAGFSVTVLPGLDFENLLPIVQFMEIKSCDSVATFEFTRTAMLSAFDRGLTVEKIFACIEKNSSYEIPQNLKFCIEEWNSAFQSAKLYSGFVLKVDESNRLLSEQNPHFMAHVKAVLAPGIFLLDSKNEQEADALLAKCGADFIGKVRGFENENIKLSFSELRPGKKLWEGKIFEKAGDQTDFKRGSEEDRAIFFIKMRKELSALGLDSEQNEVLDLRIRRKIVLNPVQLRANSVRLEKNEAYGMDFVGKVRLIERAMSSKSMIEIAMYQKPVDGVHDAIPPRILGTPLAIEKKDADASVRIRVEPSHEELVFSIGQAEFIKRIRTSFLAEEN